MRPVVLVVIDGWGIAPPGPGNAISQSNLPFWQHLNLNYPHGTLAASGEAVGLPRGQDGNTETGHLNLGAGYIVPQDLQRINYAIADGTFFQNRAFLAALDHTRKYESNLHLLGLIGSGGVHSNLEHLLALLQLCKEQQFNKVYLHLITDGRDSPPKSALVYLNQLTNYLSSVKLGKIATIMGRYYAMDRDRRWERVEPAYQALALGKGLKGTDPGQVVEESYQRGLTDEFVMPTVLDLSDSSYPGIKDGDAIVFLNFRADRARELTRAFTEEGFEEFPTKPGLKLSSFVCLTEYDKRFNLPVAFPSHELTQILGEAISQKGWRQLRTAETEKYAHVTFFFNGGREEVFPGEDRVLIPSPKDVPTYDLKPEMSAPGLTEEAVQRINSRRYNLVIMNYANSDMVGHTGDLKAAIRACEVVDFSVGEVVKAILKNNGTAILTADHGNAEQMIEYDTGEPHTAHTTNPVPLILVDEKRKKARLREGILADVAPTILSLLGLPKPEAMEGQSLLEF